MDAVCLDFQTDRLLDHNNLLCVLASSSGLDSRNLAPFILNSGLNHSIPLKIIGLLRVTNQRFYDWLAARGHGDANNGYFLYVFFDRKKFVRSIDSFLPCSSADLRPPRVEAAEGERRLRYMNSEKNKLSLCHFVNIQSCQD